MTTAFNASKASQEESHEVQTRQEHPTLAEAELRELQGLLHAERVSLLERANVTVEDGGDLQASATHGQGETEHTAVEIERRVTDVLEAHARDALAEIASALARMDEGTYGLCRDCGLPIPYERLAAMPAARCCVGCQQQHDARR